MSDPDPATPEAPAALPAAPITLRFEITESDIVAHIDAARARHRPNRSESAWSEYRVAMSTLAWVYFALQSVFAYTGTFGVGGTSGSPVLGTVCLLFAVLAFSHSRAHIRTVTLRIVPDTAQQQAATRPEYQYLLGSYELRITPEQIHQIGPHDEVKQSWFGISHAARVDNTVYIVRNDEYCVFIPVRAIGSHVQADEFVAQLNACRRAAGESGFDQLATYLAQHDVPCPKCRYNLRGVANALCPECGIAIPGSVMAGKVEPNR